MDNQHLSNQTNMLHGRSASPSAAPALNTNNRIHNSNPTSSNLRGAFLNDENTNLIRDRRSSPTTDGASEDVELITNVNIDPPLANPEMDDNGDDREVIDIPYNGVDDGFFSTRANEDGPPTDSNVGKRPDRKFPDIEFDPVPDLESIPDINIYQHKKTLAQGMMDIALFSANANQLRYVLESDQHRYYYPGIVLIAFSLIMQVAVGVGLIWNARYNVKDEREICIANKINNFTIIGIFLITVINVFISGFGVSSVQAVVVSAPT